MNSANFVKQILNTEKKSIVSNYYTSKNELPEESIARILLTGILKNQFYRSIDDATKEVLPLFIDRAIKDPEYLLKAACLARNTHMKGMVKVALAAILGSSNEQFLIRNDVRDSIIALLSTFHPGQLIQFVELIKSKQFGRGFGSRSQKLVRSAMENYGYKKLETYTLKYPSALNQLVRLVHPRYTDGRAGLIKYVLDGHKAEATGEKQKIVEELKTIKDTKIIANKMLDHEIPWDVIKGFAGLKDEIATAAMTQMGLTALLLNIHSLEEHGVFTDSGLVALKLKMNEVQNHRSIPIDFAKPYIHTTNERVRDILLDAMVNTLDVNMGMVESLDVAVSIDISGSMEGEALQTAVLMSVPFLNSKNLWFTVFNDNIYEEGVTVKKNSIWGNSFEFCTKLKNISSKEKIKNLLALRAFGGTNISLPILHAIRQKRCVDLFVIITDEQQNTGSPLMKVWKQYKQDINPKAQLWVINATNYQWHSADFGDRSVTVYQTMTPALFNNLEYIGQDIVMSIRKFSLNDFAKEQKK